jgi:DNA end-binding protein Ku
MRAIWNGVVSFGLVSVAVRLYAATHNHDIRFHQVHDADGGRIRYRRVCEVCNKEVDYADLAKGYQTEDGELVTLDADDMASLPLSSSREIEVVEFVPTEQIDPLLLDRSYYLEPDPKAVKPYALLREALRKADQVAVVKVALRQRETLALLRVRDDVIVMQTMLWPDEVRTPDFETLTTDVDLRPQELQMASVLIGSLQGEFDPSQFDDAYRKAVEDLIDYKRQHGGARPVPVAASAPGEPVTDLLTALKRSVEEARSARSARATAPPAPPSDASDVPPKKPRAARKPPTDKPAADKPASDKPGTVKPASDKPGTVKATSKAVKTTTAKATKKPAPSSKRGA